MREHMMQKTDVKVTLWGLIALMLLTRSQHFAALTHMPDASWAVFFLGGLLIRASWGFPLFLLAAVAADAFAVFGLAGDGRCVTPAYLGLLPAYYMLWLGGRYCQHHAFAGTRMLVALFSGIIAEIISSGSYWLFAIGQTASPALQESAGLLRAQMDYLTMDLAAMLAYLVAIYLAYDLLIRLIATLSPSRNDR